MKPSLPLFLLLAACASQPEATCVGSGDAVLVLSPEQTELSLFYKEERLLTFTPESFELGVVDAVDEAKSYDPWWLEAEDPLFGKVTDPSPEWLRAKAFRLVSANDDRMELELSYPGATARVTFAKETPGRFSARWRVTRAGGDAVAWMRLRARASADEGFYGLGEWGDDVNHRGKLRPMQLEVDSSSEGGSNEAHVPVPLLIGTKGWGLFVQSDRTGLFDVARKADDLVETTWAVADIGRAAPPEEATLVFHLFAEAHPLDVTRHYYDVTGYPVLPAPWALGPWIWRNENRDQAQVADDARKIRELDLATSAYWIDRPYASGVNTFDFAPNFPDPKEMIDDLHDAGLRVALWHTPYAGADAGPIREEALARGYFPPTTGLQLNKFGSPPIDLTNPAAFAWWQNLIRTRYAALGIEGYKLDFAEDVQVGLGGGRNIWRFHDGSDERTMHYGYQLLYHRVYAETLPSAGGFILARAGRWGDQKNVSVIWPGDLCATWDHEGAPKPNGGKHVGGLPASVIKGLSLGPSGFPFYGADTGGYLHSPPNKELYIRWVQQTALSTVMQIGQGSSDPVWEFDAKNGRDDETVDIYRVYTRLHLRLFPYEWTYAKNLAKDGRAIQRPLGLAHPELGVHPSDQYLFGDDLFVAPVLAPGVTARRAHLPPGNWLDWWDGTPYAGGAEVTLPAPLARLPLLVREGALIPMLRPTIDTLSPATWEGVESYANDPGLLWVRVAPGEGRFELFDGTSLSQRSSGDALTVETASGETFHKGAMLEILRGARPSEVALDGAALPRVDGADELAAAPKGWRFGGETGGTVWVKVPGGVHVVRVK